MTRKKCENLDFSQIGQVRCGNDASFAAEQLCHRGQFIILLSKIENIIREMVHIDIDFFTEKTPFFKNAGSRRLLDESWPKFYPTFLHMSTMCGKNLVEIGPQDIWQTCLT